MILLASDLEVVADGVEEGRRTFVNILKYVRMGASSNFGNMLSMAIASIALPFLPMLPTQILLNNLLYDLSELGIPFDTVSPQATARPQLWDMKGLIRFAAIMGPLSSIFDFLTFGGLLYLFKATPEEFRTAWFLESMATQILVIFIIRTFGRPWSNLPQPMLTASSLAALAVAMILPFTPIGGWFGFVAPPPIMLAGIGLLVVVYLVCAELLKPFAIRIPVGDDPDGRNERSRKLLSCVPARGSRSGTCPKPPARRWRSASSASNSPLHSYDYDPDADRIGLQAAEALGIEPRRVLKTLMAEVDGKPVCVVVPSDREVSMKRLAAAFGGKTAGMMRPADAERLTGYHVGGISPFAQKKRVPVAIEARRWRKPASI